MWVWAQAPIPPHPLLPPSVPKGVGAHGDGGGQAREVEARPEQRTSAERSGLESSWSFGQAHRPWPPTGSKRWKVLRTGFGVGAHDIRPHSYLKFNMTCQVVDTMAFLAILGRHLKSRQFIKSWMGCQMWLVTCVWFAKTQVVRFLLTQSSECSVFSSTLTGINEWLSRLPLKCCALIHSFIPPSAFSGRYECSVLP